MEEIKKEKFEKIVRARVSVAQKKWFEKQAEMRNMKVSQFIRSIPEEISHLTDLLDEKADEINTIRKFNEKRGLI
ncbi:MAG: hypothetical protein GY870_12675 [archaeon]|nr:hypothetical protein [archaeon]